MKFIKQIVLSVSLVVLLLSCTGRSAKNANQSVQSPKKTEKSLPVPDQSIHEAALNGNIDVVSDWLQKGIEADQTDEDGRSALMYAAYNGHTRVAEVLLKHKAQINLRDKSGRTSLMFAASGPYPETIKLLLDYQADPNLVDFGEHFTALMFAASEGHAENIALLLDRKADPNLKDVDGDDALTFAVKFGHTEAAELLRSGKTGNQ